MDVEGDAQLIHDQAGSDSRDPLEMEELARRLSLVVRPHPAMFCAGGALTRIGHQWTIWVPRKLAPERRAFTIAHEIAEWWFRSHEATEDLEARCDVLAGALLAPRPAFRAVLGELGPDLPELAATFGVTETCAALRLLEVTDRPGVVVSPPAVRVRGDWCWPAEQELRRLARARTLPREVERLEIRDERGRAALLAVA